MNTGPINCSLHAGRVGEQVAVDAAAGEEEGGGAVLDHVAPLVFPQVVAGKDAKFVVLAVGRSGEHWLETENILDASEMKACSARGMEGLPPAEPLPSPTCCCVAKRRAPLSGKRGKEVLSLCNLRHPSEKRLFTQRGESRVSSQARVKHAAGGRPHVAANISFPFLPFLEELVIESHHKGTWKIVDRRWVRLLF